MGREVEQAGESVVKDQHPGPWRWSLTPSGAYELVDAAGGYPLGFAGEEINDAPPGVSRLVLELIRLAPEMETVLRAIQWSGPAASSLRSPCPSCGREDNQWVNAGTAPRFRPGGHAEDCALGRILAALDAARSAT